MAPTCVIDTNVALDLWFFRRASVAPLLQALHSGVITAVGTTAMREELAHVMARAPFGAKWSADAAPEAVLSAWARHIVPVAAGAVDALPGARCTDPDDQKFIDLALHLRVGWLFTRDKAVLRLSRRLRAHGIVVGAPERWPTG